MRLLSISFVAVVLAACGDDGGSTPPIDSAPGSDAQDIDGGSALDAPVTSISLTSTAYANSGAIPLAQACTGHGGANQSPPLAWTNIPVGTMSFAIVFTDKSNGLVHSAIYDIPGTLTEIPGNVDKVYAPTAVPGAHQPTAWNGPRGYAGPCPDAPHMYEHKIYALATITVPGSAMGTSRSALVTALEANNLGSATLTATFTPP
jgi:Raf kinase inhibitor-like YbhB/YbcL family protein